MVKVSVIIPVFNVEKYLEDCLNSVLAQSLKDIEIICVNDGSVDHSLQILREYEKKYTQIKVLDQLNGGQSVARNRALDLASGKYVYFMDSDDLIVSHMLEELWDICERDDLDVLFFSGTSFYENDSLEEKHKGFINTYYRKGNYPNVVSGPEMLAELHANGDYTVSPCLQLIRRQLLEEKNIRFCEGIIHEDNCFTFQVLLSAEKAFCVNDIYFYRRVREASVMTRDENYRNLRGYYVCLVRQLQIAGEQQISEPHINQKIEYILWRLNYHVQRLYLKIPLDERERFIQMCTPYERYFFKSVILKNIEANVNNSKKINKINSELNKIKKSRSYRLGRFLIMPVWKIKGGVKCIKDHGVIYTCKLALKKTKKKILG